MTAWCCASQSPYENFINNQGLVIRKDWLNEFGMEVPKTFDELYDYLQKAKSEKNALFELNSTDGLVLDLPTA